MQNEPQLSAEMEKRLKKKLAEELHIDWAFKNVHGKPDTIIITGTPKGSYETDYNLFVENMTHFLATALEEQKQKVLEEVDESITKRVLPAPLYGNYKEDRLHQRWQVELNQLKGRDGH